MVGFKDECGRAIAGTPDCRFVQRSNMTLEPGLKCMASGCSFSSSRYLANHHSCLDRPGKREGCRTASIQHNPRTTQPCPKKNITRSGIWTNRCSRTQVWDDDSYENAEFAKACPLYSVEEINTMERTMLKLLDYRVLVSGSECAALVGC